MANVLFPIFLKLDELNVLLVGGQFAGTEKATAILRNSPNTPLKIVAKSFSDKIIQLKTEYPQIELIQRPFEDSDLENIDLLFLAIHDTAASAEIRKKARQKKILVNVADTPHECDFYLSAVVQKNDLKIAISTNGKSPTIAKRLKELFQDSLPDELDNLLQSMNKIRQQLRGNFNDKVKKLNELTSSLIEKNEVINT
jgi:siroheme synthase-like protein